MFVDSFLSLLLLMLFDFIVSCCLFIVFGLIDSSYLNVLIDSLKEHSHSLLIFKVILLKLLSFLLSSSTLFLEFSDKRYSLNAELLFKVFICHLLKASVSVFVLLSLVVMELVLELDNYNILISNKLLNTNFTFLLTTWSSLIIS